MLCSALQAPIAVSAWVFPAVQTRLLDKKDKVVDSRNARVYQEEQVAFVLVLCNAWALFTSMRNWSAEAELRPIGGLHLFTKHSH